MPTLRQGDILMKPTGLCTRCGKPETLNLERLCVDCEKDTEEDGS
jgi:NMD protein affecting ribosome stability and mRNA decay